MSDLIHDFIFDSARRTPDAEALVHGAERCSYAELAALVRQVAAVLLEQGIERGDRVAVYMEKRIENVAAMFGAAAAGCVFVPVNPLLKPEQVAYILADCNVQMAGDDRRAPGAAGAGAGKLPRPARRVAGHRGQGPAGAAAPHRLGALRAHSGSTAAAAHRRIDIDMAAILYTSGSTGAPKGVVLSHRNLVAGARSVAQYLDVGPADRLLAVLPLSFDYGLSQLNIAFLRGATAVLMNYLFPKDIIEAVARERITGLAAVPPLWTLLARLAWPASCTLRFITNSGGAMPLPTVDALRTCLPQAEIFLMYGLTEAFRSTYLPPAELARRPDSIGRAIPNAEVMVVRPDGSAVRAGRAWRAGAPRRPGRARLLERPGAHRPALPAGARPGSGLAADRTGRLVGRHRAPGRRRLPVLRRPQRRHDQGLRLPHQPDRNRSGAARDRPGQRSGRLRRRAPAARPGDGGGRGRGRGAAIRPPAWPRCSRNAGAACRPTWCRRIFRCAATTCRATRTARSTATCCASPSTCNSTTSPLHDRHS